MVTLSTLTEAGDVGINQSCHFTALPYKYFGPLDMTAV